MNRDWTAGKDVGHGVISQRSTIKLKQVTDGTSHTYMVGEKNVRPLAYLGWNGEPPDSDANPSVDYGDMEGAYSGGDANRSSAEPPFRDEDLNESSFSQFF